jgi:hypothetical protein
MMQMPCTEALRTGQQQQQQLRQLAVQRWRLHRRQRDIEGRFFEEGSLLDQ